MPKRSPRASPKQYEWRAIKIKITPAPLIGYFKAPDADLAIKLAIAERGIEGPHEQARLAAQKSERSTDPNARQATAIDLPSVDGADRAATRDVKAGYREMEEMWLAATASRAFA